MVTRKTTNKVVLKEDKADVPVEEPAKAEEKPAVAEKPVGKPDAPKEKLEPIVVDLTNLTLPLLKAVLAKVFARLKIKAGATDVFSVLSEAGVHLKLEPYEVGKGADYTKDYLKRVLEKVNGK
jgi:hypothetical protein